MLVLHRQSFLNAAVFIRSNGSVETFYISKRSLLEIATYLRKQIV